MGNMHTPQGKQDVSMNGRAIPMIMVGQAATSNFMTGVEVTGAGASMVHM